MHRVALESEIHKLLIHSLVYHNHQDLHVQGKISLDKHRSFIRG